jgi:hypothetical protein
MIAAAWLASGSEPTLSAAEVASTTLWLRRSSFTARRSKWPGIGKIPRPWLPLDCLFNAQPPAFELVAIEFFNGVCSSSPLRKLHEGKSSWTAGFTVGWYGYFYHLSHFSEEIFQFALRSIVT